MLKVTHLSITQECSEVSGEQMLLHGAGTDDHAMRMERKQKQFSN